MGYDFYAEKALPNSEKGISEVVSAKDLEEADWTTRAQILYTGLIHETLKEKIKSDKNGYPAILGAAKGLPDGFAQALQPSKDNLTLLPDGSCLIRCDVRLNRPFTSKDDRAFYPNDNPIKREWVFQTPYLAASGIKGLLRWGWRMAHGDEEPSKEKTLFGPRNDNLKDGEGQAGCLLTWPLFWDGSVGLEVINPHDRLTGTGTKPIKYEVVKAGAKGALYFLLFNRQMQEPRAFVREAVGPFLDALGVLINYSGLSAKRSADWGSVALTRADLWVKGLALEEKTTQKEAEKPEEDLWCKYKMLDENGNLKPFHEDVYTAKNIANILGISEKKIRGDKKDDALKKLEAKFAEYKEKQNEKNELPVVAAPPAISELSADSVEKLKEKIEECLRGGD